MKCNVLVVTRNLPPLVGGMERLVWHIVDELRLSYTVWVAGPSGCAKLLPDDVTAIEIPLKPLWLFLLRVKYVALWMALRHRPVVILAGSGLTAPIVWLAARLVGARSILYLHGLDIKVSHPLYRLFWIPFFCRFDSVLVNSRFTRKLAQNIGISPDRITILHPGVDLPDMDKAKNLGRDFRVRHCLADNPLMLSVGRITPRKGLLPFVTDIMPDILSEVPGALLVAIGGDPIDALSSVQNERVKVEIALSEKGFSAQVCWLGHCSQQELDEAFFAADVLVFPVQKSENDIEGFGMVAVEAAAHGLPVVAFSVDGVPDAIGHDCCGKLIPEAQNVDFSRAVVALLREKNRTERIKKCLAFAESFRWTAFGVRLRNVCQRVEIPR